MSTRLTIEFEIDAEKAERILQMLTQDNAAVRSVGISPNGQPQTGHEIKPSAVSFSGAERSILIPAQQFRQSLHGLTESLVRFVVASGPEFFNEKLAKALQFEDPKFTSSVLGKITLKLRRVGIVSDGHRHSANWYTKHNVDGRTLLRVRPDVYSLFEEALPKQAKSN